MVRFIMPCNSSSALLSKSIYIPIWLDLLLYPHAPEQKLRENLHSNMVRFIIILQTANNTNEREFTFQYG